MLIKALVKELAIKGTLHILRHGFKFYGKVFRLAYFKGVTLARSTPLKISCSESMNNGLR